MLVGAPSILRSRQDLTVHSPQPARNIAMTKSGVPDARNRDAIEHHAGIDDPIELETESNPNMLRLFRDKA